MSNDDGDDDPFLYEGGESSRRSGMDCMQLRQSAGPFHYLISEQAKSLVALQELQHEVGALLEFRDLVIETFPSLRTKMAAASSSPTTMMSSSHRHSSSSSAAVSPSNIPIAVRRDWEPRARARARKHKDGGPMKKGAETGVQDSGFGTETSSKETHSASSSSALAPSTCAGSNAETETEDELWNLLDVIHRKGIRLKDELDALQDSIRISGECATAQGDSSDLEDDFRRVLLHASADDVRHLRRERDLLLDRLAEMEAELLAGRVHTSRLQEDLENLVTAKQDLEEQLRCAVARSGQVNTRIRDLHAQFVTNKGASTTPTPAESGSGTGGGGDDGAATASAKVVLERAASAGVYGSRQCANRTLVRAARRTFLDDAMADCPTPRVAVPDSAKIAAILKERDPVVLRRHLLNSTVQNQVLQQKLSTSKSLEDLLDKAREENEELKFQLEDRNIELEGTRARVRMLEHLHKSSSVAEGSSPDIIPNLSYMLTLDKHERSRADISTSSMKAMSPLPLNLQLDHSSSTESAHDQAESARKKRPPSKIPLVKSYAAPKPPGSGGGGGKQRQSPAPGARSRSGESPGRPHSAQSIRNRSESANSHISLSGSKSTGAGLSIMSKSSRNISLSNTKDSLTGKLRSTESLTKLRDSSVGGTHGNTYSSTRSVAKKDSSHRRSSGGSVRRNNSTRDATDVKRGDLRCTTRKSQSPWVPSSLNSDFAEQFPDSLDLLQHQQLRLDFTQQQPTTFEASISYKYHTANTFLWNTPDTKFNYYDSIDTNFSSSLYQENGEHMAECDSLERQFSHASGSDIKL